MKITRTILGEVYEIELSQEEVIEAYKEAKDELDYNEIKEMLAEWDLGEILKSCKFPYPGYAYILDSRIKEAEDLILANKELLLSIYERLDGEDIDRVCDDVFSKWGKENPDFLKQFEDIKVVAYEKYKIAWLKEQNYSEDFLWQIKKEYEEEFREFGSPFSFEEYIDEHGYHGELYVCFEEFLGAEYQQIDYMKELLDVEEFNEYLNDRGIPVDMPRIEQSAVKTEADEPLRIPVFNYEHLYKEKKLKYLTNSLGEFDNDKILPEAPYEWYEDLGVSCGSLLYLVKLDNVIGVLANNEFDNCTCEDIFNGNRWVMDHFVKLKAKELTKTNEMGNCKVLYGLCTGFDDCNEIGVFLPYPMDKEEANAILKLLDKTVYNVNKEILNDLHVVMQHEKNALHQAEEIKSCIKNLMNSVCNGLETNEIENESNINISLEEKIQNISSKLSSETNNEKRNSERSM